MAKPWTSKAAGNAARSNLQESPAAAVTAFETAPAVLPYPDPCAAAYSTEELSAPREESCRTHKWQEFLNFPEWQQDSQCSLGFRPALGYRAARIYGYRRPAQLID